MKEQHSISSSHDEKFNVIGLTFGANGPYDLCCRAECVGISGASGVGKTLFLRALADLDEHGGRVVLNGRDCLSYSAPEWRRSVALIPAESRWWHYDVGSHMAERSGDKMLADMLGTFGFEVDVLDWEVSRLSTGEKQRLALLRVLVRNPSVLLLDETGSGLDYRNTLIVEDVILKYRMKNQVPVLWVSHDQEQIQRVSDRTVIMERNALILSE